jgi:hypothetical protein
MPSTCSAEAMSGMHMALRTLWIRMDDALNWSPPRCRTDRDSLFHCLGNRTRHVLGRGIARRLFDIRDEFPIPSFRSSTETRSVHRRTSWSDPAQHLVEVQLARASAPLQEQRELLVAAWVETPPPSVVRPGPAAGDITAASTPLTEIWQCLVGGAGWPADEAVWRRERAGRRPCRRSPNHRGERPSVPACR